MNVERLIDDILLRLGHDPACCPALSGGVVGEATLRARILAVLEHTAAQAVAGTPAHLLDGWEQIGGKGLQCNLSGMAVLPLPSDLLVARGIRLTSWERRVERILPHDHWLRGLQSTRWHGLRGCAQRPLAFEGLLPDGARCLELFSCRDDDRLEEGMYLPRPVIGADGELTLPDAAGQLCIELTVRVFAGAT